MSLSLSFASRRHPPLRVENVWIREDGVVVSVDRVGLAADDAALGYEEAIDLLTPMGHYSRQRHGNSREASKSFLHYCLKVRQLVERNVGVLSNLVLELLLELEG